MKPTEDATLMPDTLRYGPHSAFVELATASAKDLCRDRRGAFSILFTFVFFFLLIIGLNFVINVGGRVAPVVVIDSSVAQGAEMADELDSAGIIVVEDGKDAAANVAIAPAKGGVAILLDADANPEWLEVAAAVERTGTAYTVTDTDGEVWIDLLRANLAALSCIGLLAITFIGTSVPLTRMRENGTLRLLGTTPASKFTFIAALTPSRVVFALFVIVTIHATSVVLGYSQFWQLLRLLVTMFLGVAMFFALAYLLASRTRRAETVNNVAAVLPVMAIFASGSVLPPQLIPEPVAWVLNCLPTTWYMRAAAADFAGDAASEGLLFLYWGLMLATTVVAAVLAARLFIWDDRER